MFFMVRTIIHTWAQKEPGWFSAIRKMGFKDRFTVWKVNTLGQDLKKN